MSFAIKILILDKATLSLGKMTLDNTQKDMQYKYAPALFSTSDPTGKRWVTVQQIVTTTEAETYQLFFTATRGSGPRAIIALDDISIVDRMCEGKLLFNDYLEIL